MPRAARRTMAVAIAAMWFAGQTGAQPLEPLAPTGGPPLTSTPVTSARSLDRPPPVLGAPVGIPDSSPRPATPPPVEDKAPAPPLRRAAAFGAPSAAGSTAPAAPVPAAIVDANVARTVYQPTDDDPVNDFLTKRSDLKDRDPPRNGGTSGFPKFDFTVGKFGEGFRDRLDAAVIGEDGARFRSDHMFDGFASPVTNPFLFEDPRSLTELRPLFIYQNMPSSQPDVQGGYMAFFGTQGRIAFTDRWSVVLNKFGGLAFEPADGSSLGDDVGFAELWLGPKFTFYRSAETGSVAAAGLQFQLPVGSKGAYQDTGTLSLVPYVSYGQNFLRDFRYGSFNLLASTGYTFSTNKERSDYYWLSAHLDFDAGNLHRFYPLMELNWYLNTTNGTTTPIGAEGRDLINFGGQAKGTGLLTGAFGGRVKITESVQIGAAFEFPFAGRTDLFRNRFTLDFIWRY